jgi:DNA-binding beta-propeller fold protein YncE
MAFDGYNNKIYVTNSGDNNISVIDALTDDHVRNADRSPKTIQLLRDPGAITFSYYSGRFYVAYYDSARPGPAIAEVFGNNDTVGGRIFDFDREITGLMWNPNSQAAGRIFALGGGAPAKVWAIESYNAAPSGVALVGNSPWSPDPTMYRPMAGQNSHGYSYVANSDSNTVSMLDSIGRVYHTIAVPAGPVAIAGEEHWHAGGGHVFVACRDANVVVEITHDHVTRTWPFFNGPTAVLYNPVNNSLYVGDRSRIWRVHL